MNTAIQELIDRLQEMTDCMECSLPIIQGSGHTITDAKAQIEISRLVIEGAKTKLEEVA